MCTRRPPSAAGAVPALKVSKSSQKRTPRLGPLAASLTVRDLRNPLWDQNHQCLMGQTPLPQVQVEVGTQRRALVANLLLQALLPRSEQLLCVELDTVRYEVVWDGTGHQRSRGDVLGQSELARVMILGGFGRQVSGG